MNGRQLHDDTTFLSFYLQELKKKESSKAHTHTHTGTLIQSHINRKDEREKKKRETYKWQKKVEWIFCK